MIAAHRRNHTFAGPARPVDSSRSVRIEIGHELEASHLGRLMLVLIPVSAFGSRVTSDAGSKG